MKELIKNLIASEEASINLLGAIRRMGGIDNLTEAEAEKLVKRFKLMPKKADPEVEAYAEYKQLQASLKFWLDLRAEIGEAHNFGDMCGYDAKYDEENRRRYNAKIAEIEARMAEVEPLASRHAKFLNMPL